ncbi:MAG: hypothetical protein ISEC1_P0771 [Thiomicrorhabdus sp.]|nr:MAG: hypothetical protein ISEC1_P0771 [Thiomicrorhabdus sp.]
MNHISNQNLTKSLPESLNQTEQFRQLKALESISAIFSNTDNIELMFESVLTALLTIFECDHGWVLHTGDRNSPALKRLISSPTVSKANSTLFDFFSVETETLLMIEQCSNQSQLTIRLEPEIGQSWVIGLHYCDAAKTASSKDSALYEMISQRLLSALNNLLFIRHLAESELHFRTLANSAAEAIFVLDADIQQLVEVNEPLTQLLGYSEAELLNIPLDDLLVDSESHHALFEHCLSGEIENVKWVFLKSDNRPMRCEVRLIKLPCTDQHLIRGSVIDLNNMKQSEVQMRKLSRALEQTGDSIIITDRKGVIEYVNPAFEKITGYSAKDIIGKNNNLLRSGKHTNDFYKNLWDTVTDGHVFQEVFTNRKQDGTFYYEEKTISPLKNDEGEITHFISSGRDISERMETHERIFYLAHHDVLTDLPNRVLLFDRLEQAIYRAVRNKSMFSVMFLDLDRFKVINDTLGHDVGDLVLQVVAKRLRMALRAADSIARLGGDEFAILLEGLDSLNRAEVIAQNLIDILSQPTTIKDRDLYVTASIGISTFPADGSDAQTLLKNADIAMYQAKHLGKNTFQSFNQEMNTLTDKHFTLETELRHALENDQFEVYFQPKVHLAEQKVIGSEALLRWIHPELGIISPVDFIPLLEETGMIIEIGEWVITTVCKNINDWLAAELKPGAVAINLSVRQFSSPNIENTILDIIKKSGVPFSMIEIEITESLLIKNQNNAQRVLDAFQAHGLTLALDDFGTGYSSLSYLKRFPIDVIKIDRSFIKDLPGDSGDSALVKTIIAMAKALKLKTVAEGIETQAQYQHVNDLGCDIGQGFLMSRPIALAEFTQYLKDLHSGDKKIDYLEHSNIELNLESASEPSYEPNSGSHSLVN